MDLPCEAEIRSFCCEQVKSEFHVYVCEQTSVKTSSTNISTSSSKSGLLPARGNKKKIHHISLYGAKHHSNHHSRLAHPRSQGMLHAIGFKSKVSIMTTSVHGFIHRGAKWLNMYHWRVHSVGWWLAFLFDFPFNEMTIQNEEILGWPLASW